VLFRSNLKAALAAELQACRPQAVILVEPGEWRLTQDFAALAQSSGVPFEVRGDRHFLCPSQDFATWMRGRKQPRMEHFYRWMRGRTGWLMEDGQPAGGRWNFDEDNRSSFGKTGPGLVPEPRAFAPDAITQEVMALVAAGYAEHPGSLEHFDWPVTRAQALEALDDFMRHRLADFGRYQDAMWDALPWPRTLLFHSRLSAALNLKLLDPREVCTAAIAAWQAGSAPLAAVEGFVRQILGWREYVRGLYWHRMPQYLDDNALDAQQRLPAFYWTGRTDMNCLRNALGETLAHGYAHHIQRLMVTGLFALLLGVRPREVHEWYLAVYVDAVEWVELPNTLGMSQHADGGFMASKPYVASGKYIERMSNYCAGCRYRPDQATGERACPYTTLYWNFLDRHRERFARHPRLKLQIDNLLRKPQPEIEAIREQAARLAATLSS
jgi:deoxyribodipyrimidine photolyase-related protein